MKIMEYLIAYGMSAHKLSNDFEVSYEEAEKFIENFYASYPKLKSYFSKVQHEALATGTILINGFTNHRFLAGSTYQTYVDASEVIAYSRRTGRQVDKAV